MATTMEENVSRQNQKEKESKKKKKVSRYFIDESGGNAGDVETFAPNIDRFLPQVHKGGKDEPRQVEKDMSRYDKYEGDAPVSKEKVKRYGRGKSISKDGIRDTYQRHHYEVKQRKYDMAAKQAARTELLLTEEIGFLEVDEDEVETQRIAQKDIVEAVDITSATKYFDLKLNQFGPYRMNYTRNGRHLLIGGAKGHCAAIEWQTKKLMCEMNVMETIQDIQWLHIETMFAVAQKQWTYIYDNQGIELHCLKMLDSVLRLEFLPYHFLLASANSKGYLCYLDVSVGQKVAGHSTGLGRLDVMCQNPHNAIIHLGHAGGAVTLWSPNVKEALVKMLCHGGGVRAISVDHTGNYMATSGIDRKIKIWDLRNYKMLQSYKVGAGPGSLSFSQTGLLAGNIGNIVEVYKDCIQDTVQSPYMTHELALPISNIEFCPYEDVLGIGHTEGFTSLLIPGSGEPNFDAMEVNPFQTKKQRREGEVRMLLEKINPEFITLDNRKLGEIDSLTMQEKIDERNKIKFLKPKKVEFEPKKKQKASGKARKVQQRKQGVQEEKIRDQVREIRVIKHQEDREKVQSEQRFKKPSGVLDRFSKKDT